MRVPSRALASCSELGIGSPDLNALLSIMVGCERWLPKSWRRAQNGATLRVPGAPLRQRKRCRATGVAACCSRGVRPMRFARLRRKLLIVALLALVPLPAAAAD